MKEVSKFDESLAVKLSEEIELEIKNMKRMKKLAGGNTLK
jgi:hypothetical protein